MLTAQHLSKRYGHQVALNDVSLSLKPGVVALLGANGSGKSTLLRLLATLDQPDNGAIHWGGLAYTSNLVRLRQCIGYLPQTLELPDYLTPHHILRYLAHMRRVTAEDVDLLIHRLGLDSIAHRKTSQLSGGQLRMVGIAQAFLGQPPLLLLDEPGNGLDVLERQRLHRLISERSGLTVFSTHIPEDAERLAQAIIILHRGKVLFQGEIADLKCLVSPSGQCLSFEEAYLKLIG